MATLNNNVNISNHLMKLASPPSRKPEFINLSSSLIMAPRQGTAELIKSGNRLGGSHILMHNSKVSRDPFCLISGSFISRIGLVHRDSFQPGKQEEQTRIGK